VGEIPQRIDSTNGQRGEYLCDLNASDHPPLRDLENTSRLPSGFLELESMVLEATKAADAAVAPDPKAQNLALGKRATQSSVSPWSRGDTPEQDATRVVGGKFTGSYNCHTALEDHPWWRVDLERVCNINQIRIYNRTAGRSIMRRASRFELQISDDDKAWTTVFRRETESVIRGAKLSPFIWLPEKETLARFVRLRLLGWQFLHLDQVEIFGEEAAAAAVGG
jgi:hypothetical protein